MHRMVLGLSEHNVISAAKLMVSVCLLLCVSSAAVTSSGSNAARGSDTAFALQAGSAEAKQAEIRELKQGQVIERELIGGEAHSYRIALASGQYLKVVVEQKGIDVAVKLFGPGDQKMAEVDDDPAVGMESISVVAEVSGEYRLEVSPQNKEAATGRYEIRLEQGRQATSQDRDRFAAQGAFWQADQLRAQGTSESLRKAVEKYQQALPLWRAVEDRRKEAITLNELGFAYSTLSDTQMALQFYNQALPLSRAVRDLRQESITLHNIGVVYAKTGELQKALDYYRQALPLKRAIGERRSEANTLNSIAFAYSQLGELQKALEYYDQALPLRRVMRDRLGESQTLNSIGAVYFKLGEWQKALEHHSQGLSLARIVGDRRSEAVTLHNIGTVYAELGELQKALEYYHQALPLRRAVGDRYGEAYTLDSIGSAYFNLGDSKKALDYHNQALPLRRAVGDKYGEAYALSNVGAVYARLGKVQDAMDYFNQALRLRQAVGDRRGETFSLRNIGSAYGDLKESQKAIEYYTRALALCREIGDRNSEAFILSDIARVERDQKHLNEARAQMEASLVIVESTRRTVNSQELRASYMTTKRGFYEFYIDLLMQMHKDLPSAGYDSTALEASERARARGLLDILTEARADIRQGVDPVLLEHERTLQQQLSVKSEQLTRLLSGKHTEEQLKAARKVVETLLADYQEVETEIRAKSPRYAALTQPQPLSVGEIQQQVLDDDTLLLEYVLGEERSYLWAVTPSSIKSYELPKRTEIETAAQRVYDLLVAKADALYPEALITLSQMLLQPVADQLVRKRLVIVTEGTLQYVPFGALHAPEARRRGDAETRRGVSDRRFSSTPLVVNHEIVSLPSASVLAVLRREMGKRTSAPKTVAVLADPVFDKDDQRVRSTLKSQQADPQNGIEKETKETDRTALLSDVERSIKESGLNRFDRLLLSRREAELITALASKGQPFKALDFTASRATATNPELDQYQILHFATHSLLNNQHPELSGIVLSLVNEQGQPQDGFLRLYEIFNLKLSADLVVLSACQTALGKEIKGEGLVGLTRGFMYAGAPRVMASLWKVNDKATAELMSRFYQKMLRYGLRPAAALRAAQVSMLKEKQWEPAYYWAGFVLQGEWR